MQRNQLTREAGKLEEEISRMFESYQTDNWIKNSISKNEKEVAFVSEILSFSDKTESMFKVRKSCMVMYMINLGENSLIERRIHVMHDLKSVLSAYHERLKGVIAKYEESIVYILKYIAKSMGFIHPGDVLNRLLTLRSVKTDGIKDQENLNEEFARMNEEHVMIKNTLGQKNLLLSNQIYALDVKLANLEKEVSDMATSLKTMLTLSNDTSRLQYQISNEINAVHKLVTVDRGYVTEATTPIDKLKEISIRVATLIHAVKAAQRRNEKELRSATGSSEDFNNANITSTNCTTSNNINSTTQEGGAAAMSLSPSPIVPAIKTTEVVSYAEQSRASTASKTYPRCQLGRSLSNSTTTITAETTNQKNDFSTSRPKMKLLHLHSGIKDRNNSFREFYNEPQKPDRGRAYNFPRQNITSHERSRGRSITAPEDNTKKTSKILCFPAINGKTTKTYSAFPGLRNDKYERRKIPLVLPSMAAPSTALDSSFEQTVLE